MTLSLENLHSTVNQEHDTQTLLTNAQSVVCSMKESVNRLVKWLFFKFLFFSENVRKLK